MRRRRRVQRYAELLMIALPMLCASCAREEKTVSAQEVSSRVTRRILVNPALIDGQTIDADWLGDSAVLLVAGTGTSINVVTWSGALRAVGRKGDGPGEFRGISSVIATGDTGFVAIDAALRRASYWGIDGTLRREVPLSGSYIGGAWSTDSGLVVRSHSEDRTSILLRKVGWSSDSQPVLRTIRFTRDGSASSCQYCKIAVGADVSVWSSVADDTAYALLRLGADGSAAHVVHRLGLQLIERTEYEIDSVAKFRDWVVRQRGSDIARRAMLDAYRSLPIPTMKSRFAGGVLLDRTSDAFILRSTRRGSPAAVDEFNSNGDYLRTILLPEGARPLRVRLGRLLVMREDESGQSLVEEYKIDSVKVGYD